MTRGPEEVGVGFREGTGTEAGQVCCPIVAGAGPGAMVMQPGSDGSMPWTGSATSDGCSGQFIGAWSELDSISGAPALICPLVSVLAHWAKALVCVTIFQPFRKSPWKP